MGRVIEILDDLAATWSDSILRATWQGGLAIVAVWVLVRCRPGLLPRVACWAWRLADLKLIVALLWATPLLLPLLPPRGQPAPGLATVAPCVDSAPARTGGSPPFPPMDVSRRPGTKRTPPPIPALSHVAAYPRADSHRVGTGIEALSTRSADRARHPGRPRPEISKIDETLRAGA